MTRECYEARDDKYTEGHLPKTAHYGPIAMSLDQRKLWRIAQKPCKPPVRRNACGKPNQYTRQLDYLAALDR